MADFVYDGTPEGTRNACDRSKNGERILCPRCGAELIVAPDVDSANKYNVLPGIYCPNSAEHVCRRFELGIRVRDLLDAPNREPKTSD